VVIVGDLGAIYERERVLYRSVKIGPKRGCGSRTAAERSGCTIFMETRSRARRAQLRCR